jgi:dienelactone hydrolase
VLRPRRPPVIVERVLGLVDQSRTMRFPGQPRQPRALTTIVRYPSPAAGPLPLIVFGHGFAVTPRPYAALLEAWARAGYVVAAPVFPLENGDAPGGPNEADLVNQPRDMSFVITSLLQASAAGSGPLRGRIDPGKIAVSGQSDGGETALAVAYDERFLDSRVDAAVILSGARIPTLGDFAFPVRSPPLLATQGTADTINPPSLTHAFFDGAPRPKFLLNLLGAPHLPPYTDEQPQLGIVERVTIEFVDRYLKGARGALATMLHAGARPGLASIDAFP